MLCSGGLKGKSRAGGGDLGVTVMLEALMGVNVDMTRMT